MKETNITKKSQKKRQVGTVENFSGAGTIKVNVERKFPHKKYGKIVKSNKSYLVDYNPKIAEVSIGDMVLIEESRPVSKRKTWRFVSIVN